MNHSKSLFKYISNFKLTYILGIISLLLVDSVQLIPPKIMGYITDTLSQGDGSKKFLITSMFYIILVAIIIGIGRFLWRILIVGNAKKIEYNIRNDFFVHLQKLSINFYNTKKTGDLMALATNDLNSIIYALGFGIIMFVDAFFMTIVTLIIMLSINVKLTLISLIPLPFISFTALKFGKKIHHRYKKVQEAFSHLTDVVQENFSGIRVVKSFVQEDNEFEKFKKQNEINFKRNMDFNKIWILIQPLIQFIASLGFVIFLGFGGYLVIINDISLGEFIAFNMYLGSLIWPMMAFGQVINVLQRGAASTERLNEIFIVKPEITDNNTKNITSIDGDIQINNLTFTYPNTSVPALSNITISFKKGETLGIIGRTGSGKSTLINLLIRLYNIESGKILINNTDINDIPLKTLRRNIGFVSDPFLFSSNIYENINLAFDDIDMDKIMTASKNADIYENIMNFPDKFKTSVGERGVTLSGGQKQRISISRALIKNPEILILDDCLSAVDAKTEARILENLKTIMDSRTSIIVSHRISAVKNANQIIVLDEGTIIEHGTHEELLKLKGLYSSIYEKQQLEEKINEEGEI